MKRGLIAIIGGAGYVGTEVCARLEQAERDFVIIDKLPHAEFTEAHPGKNWRYYTADIREEREITALLRTLRPTHVVHLAAIHFIPECNRDPENTIATNVHGLAHVIAACQELGSRLVFASSASIYGGKDETCRVSDQPCPTDIYGLTKYTGELMIQRTLTDYALARLFNVYGNHDPNAHLIPKLYDCATRIGSAELGAGHTARDYVHVTDVAAALCALLDYRGKELIFNVGTGEAHKVTEVVEVVKKLYNPELEVTYANPMHLRRDDKPILRAEVDRTAEELGWQRSYSFEGGLKTVW